MTTIELKSVNKSFGNKKVLIDISLQIEQGSFFAITGASGSGKSTLLNIIGLLDFPQSGEYILDNRIISFKDKKLHSEIRNKYFGFIFQNYNLLNGFTAKENIMLPLLYQPNIKNTKLSDKLIERLNLSDILDSKVDVLSGGEKQRVAIARALINEPKIIICDEPTGNLDGANAINVVKVLKEQNNAGITVIFVTHSNAFDAYYTKKVCIENGGTINVELT